MVSRDFDLFVAFSLVVFTYIGALGLSEQCREMDEKTAKVVSGKSFMMDEQIGRQVWSQSSGTHLMVAESAVPPRKARGLAVSAPGHHKSAAASTSPKTRLLWVHIQSFVSVDPNSTRVPAASIL
ncbi:unnamed protein product [Danaus chrysippus]|uniref:(African queen) hypothetical protein n=1 Tax=Danaus chrysippus TaxID=151541 RepID=A0A8J2QTL1_9NEOP|nr:unnamed protein product [Danaus chrysippus]